MYTRREFSRMALAGIASSLPGRALRAAEKGGVTLGVQTYSFRDIAKGGDPKAVDTIVESMKACGLVECELWSPQIEPAMPFGRNTPAADREKAREALREFRVKTPLAHFEGLRKQFAAAGIRIRAYNYSFNDSFSDDEISRGFEMAKALGAEFITASTTVSVSKRVAPFADKHKMVVAMHNHSNVKDPNEFATPESFAEAMKFSKLFKMNLDIGHFTAANYDAVAFLSQHAPSVTNLHIKDRKKNQGDNAVWGTGDTPIKEVLVWLKQHKSKIPAYIEYEYKGEASTVEEVKKCLAYARSAIA